MTADALGVELASVRASCGRRRSRASASSDPQAAAAQRGGTTSIARNTSRCFPGRSICCARCGRAAKRLGLVTNGFSETHREKIALLQLGEFFDAIFIADEVGMLKPDPLLFAHACARLARHARGAAMVGDRYERDIRGAAEAGLFTVWLNVRGDPLPPGANPLPDATCASVADVSRLFEGLP